MPVINRLGNSLAIVAVPLVLLLAAWIYWPGQAGPSLLDDRTSVLVINDLRANPELVWDYVSGDRSGPLGRPVSMASFALEKLFLGNSLAISKLVSITIHLLNGSLVICLFWLLFRHIEVRGYRWLALALGAAWLLSPLHVSTVLYVVQRMAMLASTFMLLASIFYVLWRKRLQQGEFSVPMLCLVFLSLLMGVFAKENAILVLPILLLMEAFWFQFVGAEGRKIPWLQRTTLALIVLGGVGLLIALWINYDSLAAAFDLRDFTLEERLLTQSRVLWHYLGQLIYPDVVVMGLYHDDVVASRSLDNPISTGYAVAGWLVVLVFSLVLLRWRYGRLLALGVAWFLVGHSIESTVFALELYFEHRNYFPAIGLFLFLGAVFAVLVRRWPEIGSPLLVYLGCYALWLAILTGSQVQVWSSHPLLILSHVNAHPDSFRANADMAVQMANNGEFTAAQKYSARAFAASTGERSGDHDIRDLALACIANKSVESERILRLGSDNLERPFGSVHTLQTLVHLLQDDACPGFDRVAFADRMKAIFLGPDSPATASANIYLGLAVLENTLQRWQYASSYMDLYLELAPSDSQGMLMKLHFTTALGKVMEASVIRTRLLELQDQGRLTTGEQQTLLLYLEN